MTATDHHRRLMLSFEGETVPPEVAQTLRSNDVAGVTLFRPHNYRTPEQFRALNEELQRTASGDLPLLIAIDQEGGQLHAFGAPATMWPGNMALGAADDNDLTFRVGAAIGRELRAVGINVDYAPVADLASNPLNPATGARAFGDDPDLVARHVKAIILGIQSEGVAATMKHFPGKGDSEVDSHHAMPTISHGREHLEKNEFVPFRAAIDADVKLAMTGHFALPAVTGSDTLPCTLAWEANTGLLRDEMGFEGAMITDAIDMKALTQGGLQIIDMIAAVTSGVDLLLLTADAEQEERATVGLDFALSRRLISESRMLEADDRVRALRTWVAGFPPIDIDQVGSARHAALADEAAQRSITLVRNDAGLVPLTTTSDSKLLVVETEMVNLTPADTSGYEEPRLAAEIAEVVDASVISVVVPHQPSSTDIAGVFEAVRDSDIVILGTAAAALADKQASLVQAVLEAHDRVVVVAQRTPWDLMRFPDASTYLCSWSSNPASAKAVARALAGLAPITGKTPVTIGNIPSGTGIELA
ncbi:MAG: glycoside hydrolase family 3 protein [Acidimicrobiia bacterium]